MTNEQIQNFSRRIAGCSRTELVVITYDIILAYVENGEESYKEGNVKEFIFNMKKARQFVNDLTTSLDLKYEISYQLLSLYLFMDKTLFNCILKKQPIDLNCVKDMTLKLKASFEQVAKTDNSGSVINNSQGVYAGFTYSKNANLNELVMRR